MDLFHPQEAGGLESGRGDRGEEEALKSPCNKVCVVDPPSGLCKGCLRTLAEIAAWAQMTDEERERIMADLQKRKLHFPPTPTP